jgi:RPA family protein
MSDNESTSDDEESTDNYSARQTAVRTLPGEITRVNESLKDGDDDRSPVMGILPSGAAAGRVFVAGAITEVTDVSDEGDDPYYRARLAGPSGPVNIYAGTRYNEEVANTLVRILDERAYPAEYGVVGKVRTYEADGDTVNAKIDPETMFPLPSEEVMAFRLNAAARTITRALEAKDAIEEGNEDDLFEGHNFGVDDLDYSPDHTDLEDIVRTATETLESVNGSVGDPEADEADADEADSEAEA